MNGHFFCRRICVKECVIGKKCLQKFGISHFKAATKVNVNRNVYRGSDIKVHQGLTNKVQAAKYNEVQ